MNDTQKDALAKDLWKRAQQIFFTSVTNPGDRNQAERYFSMISDMVMEGDNIDFFVSPPTF